MPSKKISILVGCPTCDLRDYCLLDYLQALKNLEYDKDKINVGFMIVDNSENNDYFNRISEESKKLGIDARVVKDKHVEHARQRIVNSRNILRQTAISEKYNYFLSLEQDVIPPKDMIPKFLDSVEGLAAKNRKKPMVITGIYCVYKNLFGDGDKLYPLILKDQRKADTPKDKFMVRFYTMNELHAMLGTVKVAGCGLGCVLIDTSLLKRIYFRYDENLPSFDDMFFNKDVMLNNEEIYANTLVVCKHLIKGRKENQRWENIKK